MIGGGNTAIDAVTQAKRLGAEKVVLIYRRGRRRHVGLRFRTGAGEDAMAPNFFSMPSPVEVLADNDGHVSRLEAGAHREHAIGKAADAFPASEFVEPFDMVIKAIGEAEAG